MTQIAQPASVTPLHMTFEEFLQRTDGMFAEWVDGEVIFPMSVSSRHQRIANFLITLFNVFLLRYPIGEVLSAPYLMRLPQRPSGREPDVCFIARENYARVLHNYLDGPADLAVEIVSPDSVERDTQEKFAEYAAAGVREYWIIDPETQTAWFYVLNAEGTYEAVAPDAAGIYHSTVLPNFWLDVHWFWQEPELPMAEALQAVQTM